jgi:hypothetical protein
LDGFVAELDGEVAGDEGVEGHRRSEEWGARSEGSDRRTKN